MAVSFVNNANLLSGAFDRISRMNDPQAAALQRFQGAIPATSDTIRKDYTAGQVAKALESETDPEKKFLAASQRAMALGDEATALQYAELYDKSLDRAAQTAYQNAKLAQDRAALKAATAKAGADEIESFLKDNPQISTANTIAGMLQENALLYPTFDEDFKSREDYAKQGGVSKTLSAWGRGIGGGTSAAEREARKKFEALKKQSVVELRQQMKGQGAITDSETDLLRTMESARNPYEFELAGQQLIDIWNRKTQSAGQMRGIDASRFMAGQATPAATAGSNYSGLL